MRKSPSSPISAAGARAGDTPTVSPEADREVVLLRNFEGLSNQEVAQLLKIQPATASQRYGRALLRLRKLLEEAPPKEQA